MALRYDPSAFEYAPVSEHRRFILKCDWLWTNRQILPHRLLRNDLNPFLKWEVGHYRIIYTYDSESDELVIRLIAHRREVYRIASRLEP